MIRKIAAVPESIGTAVDKLFQEYELVESGESDILVAGFIEQLGIC